MLRRLATPLRILLLVAIFVAAHASHQVTLGAAADTHGVEAQADTDCDPSCAGTAENCGAVGHCMLALLPQTTELASSVPSVDRHRAAAEALADGHRIDLFRPPVEGT
jgi:hypothetical protein